MDVCRRISPSHYHRFTLQNVSGEHEVLPFLGLGLVLYTSFTNIEHQFMFNDFLSHITTSYHVSTGIPLAVVNTWAGFAYAELKGVLVDHEYNLI